ncbi:lipopolysaccharide transport periplasmic protein LptA [Alphaproteobacteria bacterium GH1-50]|uniref:Lipopolysaccharide transport periplasmic protein LptA n=1 Tax=Kangsaoukella pontilimi TaxID=2691042 RepID=A0A7C9MXE3_9RHOB|nr:LptA/OstA family protein [Kangsaoukella pontilimi]MXQ08314.1 lipopolysaccharide transport periplasmic protein LptA [Kangsaoukella pontilimi]
MHVPRFLSAIVLTAALCFSGPVLAQGADVALGLGGFSPDQPVEVTADSLSVDQATGRAVFNGNVLVVQGEVRMSAGEIVVIYATDEGGAPSGISELRATGGVTVVTPTDAAEAREAVYVIESGSVTMSGDVLLTQGQTALAGERLVLDLEAGSGRMEGRVRTVFGGGGN